VRQFFPVENILNWYSENKRNLPWRETSDPYKIWVSEIMLQQTRVSTAIPYYQRFLNEFPTVYDLALADRQHVLKLWEGLGYYSRARNLQDAARMVIDKYDGNLPDTLSEIKTLKGIGPYTAAAILSIAFQKPHAVVDGNVLRVLSRYFGIIDDIRNQQTKNGIQQLASEVIPHSNPGDFNQAVMELGATICLPSNPLCESCPISAACNAFKSAMTEKIPYKSPSKKIPHYDIGVGILFNNKNQVLIALRPEDVMLGGLWEFPGGKRKKDEDIRDTVRRELQEELGVEAEILEEFMTVKHAYSHFRITLKSYICKIRKGKPEPVSSQEIKWIDLTDIDRYPFPKANKDLVQRLKQNYPADK